MAALHILPALLQAFSVQMHVHGSLSEGIASWNSATQAAQEVGIDVLWWSDHDYGIFHLRTPTSFGFENSWEYEWQNESWEPLPGQLEMRKFVAERSASGNYEAVFEPPAFQGANSMRLTTDGSVAYEFLTDRISSSARSLIGDTAINVAVLPQSGETSVRLILSTHPVENLILHYYLDNNGTPERVGNTYRIPVSYEPGEWNLLSLPATQDAIAGFPEINAEDNSITGIQFSVSNGEARFDDLKIVFNTWHPETFHRQRQVLSDIESDNPGVVQLQGVEYSVQHHLNEFSTATEALERDAIENVVASIHARKGLVSLNHPFGPGANSQFMTREEILDRLLVNNAYDIDILEVGYRSRGSGVLDDFLWVWDELAKHGIYVTGTGVSDIHNWAPGMSFTNNFVSWIWAESTSKADMLRGLRSGRVFFGDITLFDGTVDIVSSNGHMGQQVADPDAVVSINGLLGSDQVSIMQDGVAVESFAGSPQVSHTVTGPGCFRVEVYSSSGKAKVFSNPICLLDPTLRRKQDEERSAEGKPPVSDPPPAPRLSE